MHRSPNPPRRVKVALLAALLVSALTLAGCGAGARTGAGSGASARRLLQETFTGSHPIRSGQLSASLSLDPTGSSLLTAPLTLAFGGPFEDRGAGRLPASDFNIAISFDGHVGRLGIVSTGTAGYITLAGSAYRLPADVFDKLESSVAPGSTASGSGRSLLSGLDIHPAGWIEDPTVVGPAEVGGTETEHIHGRLDVAAVLSDLSRLLGRASGVSAEAARLPSLGPAQRARIAAEVSGADFDLWTGTRDHTIRRLAITATLPVSGSASAKFGGLRSARLAFVLGYADIGAPETVTAPSASLPYSQFGPRLGAIVEEIEQLVLGATSTSAGAGTSTTATGPQAAYNQCLAEAGGSVAKIQKCAPLVNGAG